MNQIKLNSTNAASAVLSTSTAPLLPPLSHTISSAISPALHTMSSSSSSSSDAQSPKHQKNTSIQKKPNIAQQQMSPSTTPSQPQASDTVINTSNSNANNSEALNIQKLNRNRTRKTITKTFVVDGQTVTQTTKKTVNPEEEERQRQLIEDRKRDLIEHRRNLNEDRRKLVEQTKKQENEKESLEQDFKEQREKLLREFELKLAQIHQFRKAEIERCEEAQAIELKTTLKRLRNEHEKSIKYQREQLKDEFKLFKKELESNSNHMLMSKEHRELIKKQKEKELIKREEEYQLAQLAEMSEEEKRILKLHRQQLAHLETTSLLEKQNLIRFVFSALLNFRFPQFVRSKQITDLRFSLFLAICRNSQNIFKIFAKFYYFLLFHNVQVKRLTY
jgi:hypothetical protein